MHADALDVTEPGTLAPCPTDRFQRVATPHALLFWPFTDSENDEIFEGKINGKIEKI